MTMANNVAIHSQLGEIAKKIGHIARGDRNDFDGYDFRSIDAVYNTVGPLLAEHGVFCAVSVRNVERWRAQSASGKVQWHVEACIDYTFTSAVDGSSITCEMVGEGIDRGDKAINKAYAAAHKYCLLQLFAIPTSEKRDGDFESPETVADIMEDKLPVKDMPAMPKNPKTAQETDHALSGIIEELSESVTAKGNYRRWTAVVNGVTMAGTAFPNGIFSEQMGLELQRAFDSGAEVGITYTQKNRWKNITSVCVLDGVEEPPPHTDDEIPF